MIVFITGTDTDVGKTLVASWLCLHTGYDYFKPIQTGPDGDSQTVARLSQAVVHKETYVLKAPLSPHMAAQDEGCSILLHTISMPQVTNLFVEGAGGVCVPLHDHCFMSDLIVHFHVPIIVVARSKLGTINHTLLTLEHVRRKNIRVLGVILSGEKNARNKEAIERYGYVEVLAEIPYIDHVCGAALKSIPLTQGVKKALEMR